MLGSRSKNEYNASERQIKFSSFGGKPKLQSVHTVLCSIFYYYCNQFSISSVLRIKLEQFIRQLLKKKNVDDAKDCVKNTWRRVIIMLLLIQFMHHTL